MSSPTTEKKREKLEIFELWRDGNAFAIMGKVRRALQRAGRLDEFEEYQQQATSSDYDNLIRVTMQWADELDE